MRVRACRAENHPTQTRYQNALIVKLFFFQFINSFLSLYWIAFVRKDLLVLREQLATLMVIRFLVGNLTEVVVPYVSARCAARVARALTGACTPPPPPPP